ncbi:SseB family protein [Pseudooceanicola sp. C21-150M6]|uniref:SseB family protein n=1 Tax=Pseudooceanicola sp. C21-150M6 TaxID=3434355 RepID=UPI003D7F3A7C
MTDTPLDLAHAGMEAAPENDAARLKFYERLADSELFIMLTEEARGETFAPDLFELPDAVYALVFDREERLAAFAEKPVPYAALSGRAIVGALAGQGVGLALNPEVAPSSILIPAEAVDWLAETLANAPAQVEERISAFQRPTDLPEALLRALDIKLSMSAGLAATAYLVATSAQSGARGHLLAFIDAKPGAEPALAKATSEALTFSGLEAGTLDVGFFAADDPAAEVLSRHGLRFDLPEPKQPTRVDRIAPGSDPEKPPILK